MATKFKNIEFTEVKALIKLMPAKAAIAAKQQLFMEAEEIIGDAKEKYVPVDLGNLRSSGFVLPIGGPKHFGFDLGFGGPAAPYALAVHENPRAGKTGGVSPSGKKYKHWAKVGGWKYLEKPYNLKIKGMDERVALAVKEDLGL
jgi:hypothetical protein